MKIEVSGSTVAIEGNIKTVEHFMSIKSAVDSMLTSFKEVHFDIKDSISMTSSVIGYITKIVRKDQIHVTMNVTDERLYNLLDDLQLVSLFNIKKK